MISIALVEDDVFSREQFDFFLNHYKEKYSVSFLTSYFSDAEDYLAHSCGKNYDILFLDILLPGITGMELARRVRETDSQILIVFVTNTPQYAIEGYAVNAQDYLLKPLQEFNFEQLMKRCLSLLEERKERFILFEISDGVIKILSSQVLYVESLRHKITVHTDSGDFDLASTMKELEQQLLPYHFFRCNNSYLVNLNRVTGFRDGCAELGDIRLIVSRPKKKAFLEALTSYIGEVVK